MQLGHADACAGFYSEHSATQENRKLPRVRRDAPVANEKRVLGRAKSVQSACSGPIFVNGDRVVVRWTFRFVWRDDSVTEMEEPADQR